MAMMQLYVYFGMVYLWAAHIFLTPHLQIFFHFQTQTPGAISPALHITQDCPIFWTFLHGYSVEPTPLVFIEKPSTIDSGSR